MRERERERERERDLTWKYTMYDPYLLINIQFCNIFILISKSKRIKSFSYKCFIQLSLYKFYVVKILYLEENADNYGSMTFTVSFDEYDGTTVFNVTFFHYL